MSNAGSLPVRSFSENQTFLVYDPSTSTTARVRGADLIDYITPNLNVVRTESTTDGAANEDYKIGSVIQTTGQSAPGDGGAGIFLVVPSGEGDVAMLNGNELLTIAGDAFLRSQLNNGIVRFESLSEMESTAGRFDADAGWLVSGTGRDGDFRWNASDISGTLILSSVASTSVDSGTDTITSAGHGLVDGDGVVAQAAVNGLSLNTVYWVVNATADTFQLSATFGGAAFDLTGTTNFTVDHLLDPLKGVYVTASDDLTGVNGAWVREIDDNYDVRWFGAVGDGVTDDSPAIDACIKVAGEGREIRYYGTHAVSKTHTPLSHQRWIGSSGPCDFYFTATSSSPGIEFTSSSDFAVVENIGFRATTGFTGDAYLFNACVNCTLKDGFLRNCLNANGVKFSGAAFYNSVQNFRATSVNVALYVTGLSPDVPNNNIIDNFDVYGASGVGTAMFSDSNCSQFTLRNFISEAECSDTILDLSSGTFEFINPRFEGTTRPANDFFNISGARVTFVGDQVKIQKAVNPSLTSDLYEYSSRRINNLLEDPFFIRDLDSSGTVPPEGWSVFTGSISSFSKSSRPAGVAWIGNSLAMVSSAVQAGIRTTFSSGSIQDLARGGIAKVHALSKFAAPGTTLTVFCRAEAPSGAAQVVSENVTPGQWAVHTVELLVPSDATSINISVLMDGNGGTFEIFSPVLEVEGNIYSLTQFSAGGEMPYLPNGFFIGDTGVSVTYASAAPTTGTWKRGDRVWNRFPSVGQPKSWVCTVAGTPGTWVSEGNL